MGSYDENRSTEELVEELAAMRSRVAELEQSIAGREQDLLTKTLIEVILTLTSQTSHTAVLDEILRQAQRLVPCTTSNIMLLEGDVLRVAGWGDYGVFGSEDLISSLAQPLHEFPLDAQVIRSRKPLIISDTRHEPGWVVMETTGWIRSNVMVPICLHDRALGLLRLDSDTPGQFTVEDAEKLLPLANAAAIALENARLLGEAQRRNREQALLNRVIAAASATLEPNVVLEITCRELALAFDVPQAAAALLNESRTASTVVAEYLTQGCPSALGAVIPVEGNPTTQYVLQHKEPLAVPDAQHDPRVAALHDLMRQRGTVSLLILPLVVRRRVVGTIGLDATERREFSDDEIRLAANAAAAVARALENAHLFKAEREARQLSDTLSEIARELNLAPSLDAALDLVLSHMERVIAFDSGSVMLLENGRMSVAAVRGFKEPGRVLNGHFDLDVAPLNREVVQTRRPLVVDSAADDPRWFEALLTDGLDHELASVQSWMGVPLLIQDRVIGMLTADKKEPHFYRPKEAELALAFAAHAAVAIERTRLYEQAQQRATRLSTLNEIGRVVSTLLDIEDVLEAIFQQVQRSLSLDAFYFCLYDAETNRVSYPLMYDGGEYYQDDGVFLVQDSHLGHTIKTATPQLINRSAEELAALTRPRHPVGDASKVSASLLFAPLQVGQRVIGAISVQSYRLNAYGQEDLALLAGVASQAAIAIENARLLIDLQHRNTQLQTAAQVSKSASTILDPERLMGQAVDLIQERFGFYYVGIFLVDKAGEYAVLRAGSGEVGGRMMAEGHRLLVGGESMVGWCVANVQARLTLGVGEEAFRSDSPYLPETRSEMALPLVARGKAIGALTVRSVEDAAFSNEDVAVLQAMTDQLAVAIENARLFEESQRQTQELAGLYDIALATGGALETGVLLAHLYEQVRRLIALDSFVVVLYHAASGEIEVALAMEEGEVVDGAVGMRLPLAEAGLTGWVMRAGQPLMVGDVQVEPMPVEPKRIGQPVRSWLGVPLIALDRLVGAVSVQSFRPHAFDDADRRFLESVARQVAIALENARLYEQAQQEIAQRNRTQEELRRLIDFNAGIVQNMAEGIIMEDAQGYFTFINPAAAAMLDYSLAELVGKHWTAVVPPDQQSIVRAADERRGRGASRFEVQLVRKDGTRFPVLASVSSRFEQGDLVGTLAVFTDIAERVQAEEEKRVLQEKLARAQRMESLGVLAGGVAHELNNILGPLVAYPDLIMLDLPENSSIRDDLLRIKQSAERAAAVVQDLLTLARRGAYRMIPLSLNTVVEDFRQSPSFTELRARSPHVYVNMDLTADLLNVAGSAPHLYKVVMNLVLNAFEAMPHGGRLEVTTECVSLDRPILGYDYVEAGDYVVLRVSDTGVGIEENDLGRIFEPFYTKKEMGRSGSGLGLAVVYGVVHDHKGRIDVQTEVGRGTDFIIYLPVTRETLLAEEEARADYSGSETVLVVDDLAEQRELAIKLLSSLGYKVQAVASGQEAVEYLAQNDVDILVLDMIMEDGFDGLDTYRQIVKIRPGQRAIIASGFSETTRVKEAQRLGAGPFVKKPYTLETIGRAVHQELQRR